MASFQATTMLMAMILGFLIKPYADRRVVEIGKAGANDKIEFRIPFFGDVQLTVYYTLALVCVALFFGAFLFYFLDFLVAKRPTLYFESLVVGWAIFFSSFTLKFFLGLVLGFFVREFFDYLSSSDKSTLSPYVFFARLAFMLVLIVVGFFQKDIASYAKNAERISTPYFSLEFKPSSNTEARVYFEAPSTETRTDFQNGVVGLLAASRAPFTDLAKFHSFCSLSEGPVCGLELHSAPVTFGDLKLWNSRQENFGGHKDIRKSRANLVKQRYYYANKAAKSFPKFNYRNADESGVLYPVTLDYFASFQYLSDCLYIFSQRYPNGLPILDEISEYAADYTLSLIDKIDGRSDYWNDGGKKRFQKVLERILDGGEGQLDPGGYSCELDGNQKSVVVEQMMASEEYQQAVAYYYSEVGGGGGLPYRPIFLANFLLMSGHGVEAASHLKNSYKDYLTTRAGYDEIGFADFLWRLHFLSHIDSLAEVNSKKLGLSQYRREWPKSLRKVTDLMESWLLENTNIGSFDLENLVKKCASGGLSFKPMHKKRNKGGVGSYDPTALFGIDESDVIFYLSNYRKPHKIFSSIGAADFEAVGVREYLRVLIQFYIEKRLDYLSASFSSGERIDAETLEGAVQFFSVAINDSFDLRKCYDNQDVTSRTVKRARFAFAAAEGFAFYAQELQQQDVLNQTLQSLSSVSNAPLVALCRSSVALRFTHALLKGFKEEMLTSVGLALVERSSDMLVKIGPNTCRFDSSADDLDNILNAGSKLFVRSP